MTKDIYPRLRETGAIPEAWLSDSPDSEQKPMANPLRATDTDPPMLEVVCFIDAAFRAAVLRNQMPVTVEMVAESKGCGTITFAEYVSELAARGHDIKAIHEAAAVLRNDFSSALAKRKSNALAFFNLMKTQWYVTDDEVREFIDAESIYELIELVLEHTDTTRARLNARKRHAENRSMKAEAFEWLDRNMVNFKSMDKAAEAVTKQQPIAFRTARDWVGEWKRLRSAGTP